MDCFFCKGALVEATTTFMVDIGQCVVIVKNVPAKVCQQCGEETFSNDVAKRLEKIVETVRNSLIKEVAIYDYTQAA